MSRTQSRQDRLEDALDLEIATGTNQCVVSLSTHLSFGESNCGGYTAALVLKAARSYAAHHPKLKDQPDVRFSSISLLRPIFPAKAQLCLKVQELAYSRLWSMLRVEGYQGDKLCVCADVMIVNLDSPGVDLSSGWQLQPRPTPVDLSDLENHRDNNWICYHTAFHPTGFRRAQSYVKNFVPTNGPSYYNEQWMLPGWDCHPTGSRDDSMPEARWTNEHIAYLVDIVLPLQENFFPQKPNQPPAIGSMSAAISFGKAQREARNAGRQDWRDIQADGSRSDGFKVFMAQGNMVSGTLNISIEFKKKLPQDGVRWLYARTEVKNVQAGRFDLQALIFDESHNLIAIRNGIEQLLDPSSKNQRVQKI